MTTPTAQSVTGTDVVSYAQKFIGVPYVWGGMSPKGFDCSGLVKYAYAKFGITLPRTSQEQAHVGVTVPASAIQPGDLLFYNTTGTDSHVALYAGGGMQVVARHTGLPVMMQKVGNFTHAQRVLHNPGSGIGGIGGVTPVGYQAAGGIPGLPTPQDVISGFLDAIGVPDMKDLFERLGLIVLGAGMVIVGIYLLNKNATEKILGPAKEDVKKNVKESFKGTGKSSDGSSPVGSDSDAVVT